MAAGLTYEEHLRKGENKIMASLMPYLKLYAEGEHPELVSRKRVAG